MANLIRRREPSLPTLAMARLDPLRMIRSMLGGDPFAEMESMLPSALGTEGVFMPKLDVKETGDAYLFRADLPGVREEDLDVSLTGNRLTISGRREEEEEKEGERYYTYERSFGSFSRSFTLPEGADVDKVNAELKEGVLRVMVPKKPQVQSKKVPIGAETKKAVEVEPKKTKAA